LRIVNPEVVVAKRKSASTDASTSTAKTLGVALDHIGERVAAWRQQHAQIVAEIRLVVDRASRMLADVGEHVAPSRGSAGATPRERRGGRPKGYRISEATRAKLRAAWARRKTGSGGGSTASAGPARKGRRKRTMSAEARARIAAAQKKRWAAVRKAKGTES
jgi:hypothetical protein